MGDDGQSSLDKCLVCVKYINNQIIISNLNIFEGIWTLSTKPQTTRYSLCTIIFVHI